MTQNAHESPAPTDESRGHVAQDTSLAFAALRHRDFRPYFLTTMLSMMADNIEHVISYWIIFELFHSPTLAGFAVVSHWLPFLLLSWYFGGLSDRFDYRRIIQASQIMYMGVSVAWAILIMTDSLEMWHAAVLLVVHGLAGTLWGPGSQLILHNLVGPEHLQSAVRLNATGRQLGVLLGPAVGGAMMLIIGPYVALLVNTLIYLPLTVWLQTVPYAGRRPEGANARKFSWKTALGTLREGNPTVVSMVCLAGVASFFIGTAFQAQMPEFAHDLGTDSMGYGYAALLAANGAGAVVGGTIAGRQRHAGGECTYRGRTGNFLVHQSGRLRVRVDLPVGARFFVHRGRSQSVIYVHGSNPGPTQCSTGTQRTLYWSLHHVCTGSQNLQWGHRGGCRRLHRHSLVTGLECRRRIRFS